MAYEVAAVVHRLWVVGGESHAVGVGECGVDGFAAVCAGEVVSCGAALELVLLSSVCAVSFAVAYAFRCHARAPLLGADPDGGCRVCGYRAPV